ELLPLAALRGEHVAPSGGDGVVATPSLTGLFDPPTPDPLAFFELIERGVEGREVERQRRAGSRLDQFGELVSVPRLVFEEGQHDQFRCPFLRFADRASNFHRPHYILESRILSTAAIRPPRRTPPAGEPSDGRQHMKEKDGQVTPGAIGQDPRHSSETRANQ